MSNFNKVKEWFNKGKDQGKKDAEERVNKARGEVSEKSSKAKEMAEKIGEKVVTNVGRVWGRVTAVTDAAKEDLNKTKDASCPEDADLKAETNTAENNTVEKPAPDQNA